jgi:hypothetical protein
MMSHHSIYNGLGHAFFLLNTAQYIVSRHSMSRFPIHAADRPTIVQYILLHSNEYMYLNHWLCHYTIHPQKCLHLHAKIFLSRLPYYLSIFPHIWHRQPKFEHLDHAFSLFSTILYILRRF